MLSSLRRILEMIRFSHTLFALPFAMLSAVMAWTTPVPDGSRLPFRWRDLIGILLCMVLARSSAMAFNRLADRRVDAANPRTAGRHLPSGSLSVSLVTIFTIFCSALFFATTILFLPNRLPLILAVPVLAVLLIYSYTKRFTALAHFWLGASLMLAPICAWIALRGTILEKQPSDLLPAIWLGFAVLMWVAGFDVIYACQDTDFDRRAKLHSIPALVGVRRALWIAAICHLGTVLILLSLPLIAPQLGLGWVYMIGIASIMVLLVYEHWLVSADDLTRVNQAFFVVNAIISLGLFVIGTLDLLVL